MDAVNEIVICKYCNQPEYWGDMRWNNGRCMCRNCYREDYERTRRESYKWDDLDGKRPTMDEYLDQEERRNEGNYRDQGGEDCRQSNAGGRPLQV